jgi:hypothetical protein
MELSKIFQSKAFKIIIRIFAALAIILLIFEAGLVVGYKKANFSFKWGENYHLNFGGPRGGFLEDARGRDMIDSHGITGQIIKIETSTIIIGGRDNVEKIVNLNDDTAIMRFRDQIKPADLKIGELVVIIGDPNDAGQINAKFVRIMPSPGANMMPLPPSNTPMPSSVKP